MSKLNKTTKLNNCYLDLDRAATYFCLDSEGNTHTIFLAHALKILNEVKDKKLNKFKKEISELKKITSKNGFSKEEKMNIADNILTTGILLKSA